MTDTTSASATMPASVREILACPKCRGTLVDRAAESALDCPRCGLRYAIRSGLPVLLVESAQAITP